MEALHELVEHIVELKKQKADPSAIQDACRSGTMALLRLRKQYRAAALDSEAVRERAAGAKAQLDRFVLQLHNLLYEKQFFEKEILSCTNFRSAVPDDQIALISEAEFMASGAGGATDAAALSSDPHQLMLARLTHELNTRKLLTEQLKRAQAARQQESGRAAAEKARLETLQASLRGLEQAGRPLVGVLGPRLEMRAQQRGAFLLPMPLWIIYSQFSAARDALELPVDVEVDGSVEEAARLAASGAPGGGGDVGGEGGSSGGRSGGGGAGGAAGGGGPPSKRRKKEGSMQPEEDIYQVGGAGCGLLSCVRCPIGRVPSNIMPLCAA